MNIYTYLKKMYYFSGSFVGVARIVIKDHLFVLCQIIYQQ